MILNKEEKPKQKPRYQVNVRLSYENDKDIIDALELADKKQTFIKEAIREYLRLFT